MGLFNSEYVDLEYELKDAKSGSSTSIVYSDLEKIAELSTNISRSIQEVFFNYKL